jgi:succinate dehydrogenase/fumarate reductase flavoprotein subunit
MPIELDQSSDEVIETDFLIVGGGVSGCSAAISSKKKNAGIQVLILEKAHINTSGEVLGVDHNPIPFALAGGLTAGENFHKKMAEWPGFRNAKILDINDQSAVRALPIMIELGIDLTEDDGTLKMIQMANPSQPVPGADGKVKADTVFYRGSDVKAKLAIAAKKCGARIINRTMVTALIVKDGAIVGATAVNFRTGKYLVVKARAVLLSSGKCNRLYPCPSAPFPNSLFLNMNSNANCGEGISAAYKAGARLANMEFVQSFPVGAGVGVGHPYYAKLRTATGEIAKDKYPMLKNPPKGHLQIFCLPFIGPMSVEDFDKEMFFGDPSVFDVQDIRHMYFSASAEKPHMVKIDALRGDTVKASRIEIKPHLVALHNAGCVAENEMAETRIKNLFTIGDMNADTGGSVSGCLVWGDRIGTHIAESIKDTKGPEFSGEQLEQVRADKAQSMAPLGMSDGVNPLELEDYIRKINLNYVGLRKSEAKLKRAIELFEIAKEQFVPALGATNPHELMRTLEVKSIIEISKLHAEASLIRKESRFAPSHYRSDYPEQDDVNWQKAIVMENRNGKMQYALETR